MEADHVFGEEDDHNSQSGDLHQKGQSHHNRTVKQEVKQFFRHVDTFFLKEPVVGSVQPDYPALDLALVDLDNAVGGATGSGIHDP